MLTHIVFSLIDMLKFITLVVFLIKLILVKNGLYDGYRKTLQLNLKNLYILMSFSIAYILYTVSNICYYFPHVSYVLRMRCTLYRNIFIIDAFILVQSFLIDLPTHETLLPNQLNLKNSLLSNRKNKEISKAFPIFLLLEVLLQSAIFTLKYFPTYTYLIQFTTLIASILNCGLTYFLYKFCTYSVNKIIIKNFLTINLCTFFIIFMEWGLLSIDKSFINLYTQKMFFYILMFFKSLRLFALIKSLFCKEIGESLYVNYY